MLKGILWDNDGVLVDTEQLFFQTNKELLNRYGLDLDEKDFFNWYLINNCGSWHLFKEIGFDDEQMPEIRRQRSDLYRQKLETATQLENAGIADLLQNLHGRVSMGVVTSAYREHFETIHARLNLRNYFQFALTNEDYEGSKPSPAPYLKGLEQIGLAALNCVVVEDSPRGLTAALAANLRCIILRHSLMRDYPFAGAYAVVDNIEQLQQTLNNML